MMSLRARELRRQHWMRDTLPSPRPETGRDNARFQMARRFIRAMGWRLHGARP